MAYPMLGKVPAGMASIFTALLLIVSIGGKKPGF
jgi:hypothetical protein